NIPLTPAELKQRVECVECGTRFFAAELLTQGPAPIQEAPPEPEALPESPKRRRHSGLGVASFIIAVLVGGLDVLLMIVVAIGIAKSAASARESDRGGDRDRAEGFYVPPQRLNWRRKIAQDVVAGGTAMVCLNCMSIPLCLVGVGLGVAGL